MKRVLLSWVFLALCVTLTADVQVNAIGRGTGDGNVAKEQALADALRSAIQKGAGVNVLSTTKASNYILDYDRIFSRAFGYVKSYKVTKTYTDEAGFFTVEIDAVVGKGTPGMNDYLGMRQIIAMKGSPRVLIRTTGQIAGIGDSNKLISGMLQEIALKCGFNTIKLRQFAEAENKRAKRDAMGGDTVSAGYRKADVRQNYDFIIDAEVNGSYNGESELYGMKTQRFSLSADLGAVYPNGRAIAQVTLPSKETDIGKVSGSTPAARAALMKYLGSDSGKNFRALLMSILSAWVAEFDAGAKITVELTGLDRSSFDRLVASLKGSEGINAVNVREFDPKFKSTIEVDTVLDTHTLSGLLEQQSKGILKTDRETNDYIQLTAESSGIGASWWIFVGIIGAVGLFVVISFVIMYRKKSSR